MALNFTTWNETIANLTAQDINAVEYVQILPSAIDYAEGRMYRETNFLATVVRDTSGSLVANNRNFTLPTTLGIFRVVYDINVFTPSGSQTTRNQLVPVSRDVLDFLWPSDTAESVSTIPVMWAPITDQTIILGPPPGSNYTVEVVGRVQPVPLSALNPTTYLTQTFPDAFIAATMIYMTGWMKNWGAQADDPKSAMSWETQYQKLMASVNLQDAQQKFAATSWTSQEPQPLATPQRG